MTRTKGAKNKPKGETVQQQTETAERTTTETNLATQPAGQDVAIFTPARLAYHPAIEERFGVDKGQWKVLVEAIYPAAKSADSVVMALSYCKSRNLDPFKRPVHIVPMWDGTRGGYVETVWPGISELRTTASRTKGYAGCDEADFGPEKTVTIEGRVKRNGNWETEKVGVTFPEWCRLTVYRIVGEHRCKFVGPKVKWLETYATQGASDLPNKMWQERPEGQLEKCAEAAALRRAFPEELGNELTAEEMEGRRLHDITIDTAAPVAASRDQGPPRTPPAATAPPTDPEQPHDGTPPPREKKADPISSGPPRTAETAVEIMKPKPAATKPAAPKAADKSLEPFRIPGTGHTYESWAEQYVDLIKTSPDTATVYAWIDRNSREFQDGDKMAAGPLARLEKGKPSVYATVRTATERVMAALKDATKKAEEKAAKKAAPPPSDMDDGPGDMSDGAADAPTDPEAILAAIDSELAAVEDADQLQPVWEKACEPLVAKLDFPADVDHAQSLFHRHEKRLGGD